MKNVFTYILCTACIAIAVVLVFNDSLVAVLFGLGWTFILWASSRTIPSLWERYALINGAIMARLLRAMCAKDNN